MTLPHLPHDSDDCTGEWTQIGKRGPGGLWRCTVCGREHPSTPENDAASDREYAHGVLMRSQARQWRLRDLLKGAKFHGVVFDVPEEPEEGEEWKGRHIP